MGGRACIRGMRITVSLIVNLVANGLSSEQIIREYPELDPDDIRQGLQYASALANEEIGFSRARLREIPGGQGRVHHDRQGLTSSASRRLASP